MRERQTMKAIGEKILTGELVPPSEGTSDGTPGGSTPTAAPLPE